MLVIASALLALAIASLVLAHPQLWVSVQRLAASVWQSAKNTRVKIQRAKHARRPVASVSNTVKAGRSKPLGALEAGVTKVTLPPRSGDVVFCVAFWEF